MSAAVLITDNFVDDEKGIAGYVRVQVWLWPNIVSLDAPAIAVLWQWLLAHGLRLRLSPVEPLVLALAVWSLYVGDRILDALQPVAEGWEPARKRFYRRHFRIASMLGLGVALLILPVAYHVLRRSTFYGGLALAVPVTCYFGLVHLAPGRWRALWPREAMVALLFTLGTFLAVWMVDGRNTWAIGAPAVLFSLLCWVNCSAIESWEWQKSRGGAGGAPSASAHWIAQHLSAIATGVAILAAIIGFLSIAPLEFALAGFGSGIVLALLGAYRSHLRVNTLRVAVDAALCTPLVALAAVWVR